MLPRRITFTLITLVDFKDRQNLDSLLNVFESFPILQPQKWAKDDRAKSKQPYERQALAKMVSTCSSEAIPMLYGKKPVPYEFFFEFERNHQNSANKCLNGVYWYLDAPPNFNDSLDSIFKFSQKLADIVCPEYGSINLIWDHPQIGELISPGIKIPEFQQNGVPSLGIRTWMGLDIIDKIGIDRLKSCGAIVHQTDWGGIQLDLVEQPWLADFDTLLQAKQRIMANLEPSGMFGDYSNYPWPLYSPAPNWIPIPLN
jgi:hypothetical protein